MLVIQRESAVVDLHELLREGVEELVVSRGTRRGEGLRELDEVQRCEKGIGFHYYYYYQILLFILYSITDIIA